MQLHPLLRATLDQWNLFELLSFEWTFKCFAGKRRPVGLCFIIGQQKGAVVEAGDMKGEPPTVDQGIARDRAAAVVTDCDEHGFFVQDEVGDVILPNDAPW